MQVVAIIRVRGKRGQILHKITTNDLTSFGYNNVFLKNLIKLSNIITSNVLPHNPITIRSEWKHVQYWPKKSSRFYTVNLCKNVNFFLASTVLLT